MKLQQHLELVNKILTVTPLMDLVFNLAILILVANIAIVNQAMEDGDVIMLEKLILKKQFQTLKLQLKV